MRQPISFFAKAICRSTTSATAGPQPRKKIFIVANRVYGGWRKSSAWKRRVRSAMIGWCATVVVCCRFSAISYHHAPAQAKVIVREWESGKLEIRYRGEKIAWKEIPALPERPLPKRQLRERLRPVRPSATHPWRGDYRHMPTPRYSAQW